MKTQRLNKLAKVRLIIAIKKYERVRAYYLSPKHCAYCDAPIPYEKRDQSFCCKSCSTTVVRSRPWDMTITCCATCHKELYGEHRLHVKYCSQFCYQKNRWTEIVNEAEKTGRFNDARTAKKYLLRKKGHQCELCRRKRFQGVPIELQIHHRNADPKDHRIRNLQLLCSLCHSMTDTYCGKKHRYVRKAA